MSTENKIIIFCGNVCFSTELVRRDFNYSLDCPGNFLFDSNTFLFVHICEHQRYVGSEEVVHLVTQRRFTKQLRSPHQITNGHVEVSVAWWPVRDSCERVSHEDVLRTEINENRVAHTLIFLKKSWCDRKCASFKRSEQTKPLRCNST